MVAQDKYAVSASPGCAEVDRVRGRRVAGTERSSAAWMRWLFGAWPDFALVDGGANLVVELREVAIGSE